jgi:polygalacturonase
MTLVLLIATMTVLVGCGGTSYKEPAQIVQVGSTATASKLDANLPTEPTLPTAAQVCSTLEASNSLVSFPDGSLPPQADPSVAGAGVAANAATTNPDQARIQAALDACGKAVDTEVGATIYQADAAAVTTQTAAQNAAGNKYINISGASAEELAKPQYHASKYAVRLVKSTTGSGNAFISGPLVLPSGVTLWIDKGVTLFGSRDVMTYLPAATTYCANTATSSSKAGSSGNCKALISGTNIVNSAVVGEGAIDGRGYSEIVSTNKYYPLMKVDLTCSNTYAAYAASPSTFAADGTPCDNGGTVVDSKSPARNMTWWDLAFLGNMVNNGTTGYSSQSVPRLMVYNYAKNLTLYKVTLNNSANFHVVPAGVDGFIVWNVKVQTPSLAAYQAATGNGNPLFTGSLFTAGGNGIEGNVKNTDAFDPASSSKLTSGKLNTGSTTTSANAIAFDGYLKNVYFAYNFISTGDDDFAVKGSNNPSVAGSGLPGVDGDRGVFSYLKHGLVVAHNHIYAGHGISIGSETNSGVRNMYVYDNTFDGGEEGLRIKSDQARGGEVMNVYYNNICMRNLENSLLFTPYYSTKAGSGAIPNFHDIHLSNILMSGTTEVKLQGFAATVDNPQYPLVMTLNNVVTDSPTSLDVIDSDANLALSGMINLPLATDADKRVVVSGTTPVQFLDPTLVQQNVVDCSQAFIDFPSLTSPAGTTWLPPTRY